MGRPGGPGPLDPIFDVDTIFGAISYDNTPGTPRLPCTINQAAGQDDPTVTLPILFTAVFSRAVTGFATGDVTITGTAGATTGVVTEVAPFDGTTYQVAVSDVTGEGTVTATILASVCTAVDDGMANGHSTSTDNTVTYAISYVDQFCDAFPTPGNVVWSAHYSGNAWNLLGDGGGGSFVVSGGVAAFAGLNAAKEIQHLATTDRNAYVEATNARSFVGGLADRQIRLLLNVGRDGEGSTAGASTFYYGIMGQISGVPTIAIGKHIGNADNTLATMAYTVAVGDVFRFRHDGIGNLAIDVNGVQTLTAYDNLVATSPASLYLRATGVGLGGIVGNTSDSVGVGGFCSGIWGQGTTPAPEEPPAPWFYSDALDTDTLTSGVWTEEGTGNLAVVINSVTLLGPTWRGSMSSPSGETANYAKLPSAVAAANLSADQFIEFSTNQLDIGNPLRMLLRSSSTTTGYYFRWFTSGSFPFNSSFWEIGIMPGTVLLTSADQGSSVAAGRIRMEAQGTALRIKRNGVTVLSTTDGSISAANTLRVGPRGAGGSPGWIYDIVVGNI